MATDEDTPMRDPSSDAGSDSGSDSESGDAKQVEWLATTRAKRSTAGNRLKAMLANEEPAAEDDDLELLFAEDGDDEGFTDVDANDSDVHMDSSSDDEDQNEGEAEDEGEKELQRQAKQKKLAQRRRGTNAVIPAKFRKKVRIEQPTTASQSPAPQPARKPPRPKKKSERASWLPTAADMPTRASERSTTRLSKEQLHQQMVEREKKRQKLVEAMERKAKKAEAMKKPPLTQEQRLAEAALVEKRNSKSLNRWEEAEKQREEERLRKIAALQNRKLDGPVVTFWSGIQELDNEQMKHVGKMVSIEEKAPRKKRQSLAVAAPDVRPVSPVEDFKPTMVGQGQTSDPPAPPARVPVQAPAPPPTIPSIASPSAPAPPPSLPLQPPSAPTPTPSIPSPQQAQSAAPVMEAPRFAPMPGAQPVASGTSAPPPMQHPSSLLPPATGLSTPALAPPVQQLSFAPPTQPSSLQPPPGPMAPPPAPPPPDLRSGGSGFLAAPTMLGFGAPPQIGGQVPVMGMVAPSMQSNGLAAPNTGRSSPHGPSPLSMPQQAMQPIQPVAPVGQAAPKIQPNPPSLQLPTGSTAQPQQHQAFLQGKQAPRLPDTPLDSPALSQQVGKVTKSCIILSNFDETAIKDRQVQTQILFGRKMNKLAKPAPPPLCVITNHPAKYRDPKTGLPYYNSYAYKEIQRLHRGDYKWSQLLGAWVGSGTFAARGVPERFLDPNFQKPEGKPIPPAANAKGKDHEEQSAGQEPSMTFTAVAPVTAP